MKKILWIASYPKSGNTFMRSLLSSLIYTDSGEFNFNLLKKVKQFDIHLYFKFIKMINEDDYRKINDIKVVSKYWKLAQKKFIEIDSNFIFKTHAANLMWEKFKYTDEERTLGVIYLVRDPRDIVISYAHHMNKKIDEVVDSIAKKDSVVINSANRVAVPLSSWDVHIKSWEMLNVPKYIVRYEDLISNTKKIFSEIVNFLENDLKIDFAISEEKFNTIIQSTKFNRLKKMEQEGGFPESNKKNIFFRKGKHGDGKQLDKISSDKLILNFKEVMKKFKYL